jgi:hypothetical protein
MAANATAPAIGFDVPGERDDQRAQAAERIERLAQAGFGPAADAALTDVLASGPAATSLLLGYLTEDVGLRFRDRDEVEAALAALPALANADPDAFFAQVGPPDEVPELLGFYLAQVDDPRAADLILELARLEDDWTLIGADALVARRDRRLVPLLVERLAADDPDDRLEAVIALEAFGEESDLASLRDREPHETDRDVRAQIARALAAREDHPSGALRYFWIVLNATTPFGEPVEFGISAYDEADALAVLREMAFGSAQMPPVRELVADVERVDPDRAPRGRPTLRGMWMPHEAAVGDGAPYVVDLWGTP